MLATTVQAVSSQADHRKDSDGSVISLVVCSSRGVTRLQKKESKSWLVAVVYGHVPADGARRGSPFQAASPVFSILKVRSPLVRVLPQTR